MMTKSMEDDYLAWKSKILPKIAAHFGITADMAKALRARPHVPLFDIENVSVSQEALFHGEHSTGKPRRWQLKQKIGKVEGYDVVTQNLAYGEVTYGVCLLA